MDIWWIRRKDGKIDIADISHWESGDVAWTPGSEILLREFELIEKVQPPESDAPQPNDKEA
jgi:hypothetical protein